MSSEFGKSTEESFREEVISEIDSREWMEVYLAEIAEKDFPGWRKSMAMAESYRNCMAVSDDLKVQSLHV